MDIVIDVILLLSPWVSPSFCMHTASQMCCFGQISIKPAGVQNARCCGGQGYNPAHQVNMVKDIVYCISDHEGIDTSLKYSENIPISTLSSPMRVERMTFQVPVGTLVTETSPCNKSMCWSPRGRRPLVVSASDFRPVKSLVRAVVSAAWCGIAILK